MVMSDNDISKYFSDAEAEELFGISHSKLRTGQRFGLIESASALDQGRYIRMWSYVDLVKAGCASMMSENMAFPFAACCCILAAFYRAVPEAENVHEYAALNTPVPAEKLRESWTRHSVIASANRSVLFMMTGDVSVVLGRLEPDADGRVGFILDPDALLPSVDQSIAWSAFNPVAATAKMVSIVDTA